MPIKDRENSQELATGVWLFYERSSAHPVEYAITLRIRRDGRWQTIHLFDNSHAVDEHHEHHYVGDCKQAPIVSRGSTNLAMAAAMTKLRTRWSDILRAWEKTL